MSARATCCVRSPSSHEWWRQHMRAHEAGALHADINVRGPAWLQKPADVNALEPMLWSMTTRKTDSGALEIGGVDLRDLARQHGTPAYVLDEADFRARAR